MKTRISPIFWRTRTRPCRRTLSYCVDFVEHLDRTLSTPTPKEEKVIRMRFGIGEKYDHTLEEVGQVFEVTRERVRQIGASP